MKPLHTMRKNGPRAGSTLAARGLCASALVALVAGLAACATRLDPAPVVDYSSDNGAYAGGRGASGTSGANSTYAGGNGAGRAGGTVDAPPPAPSYGPTPPGYYRVKPGDNLFRIALNNGQNYRDVAAWNGLTDPGQIEVGQLLRVAPGANDANGAGKAVGAGGARGGGRRGVPPVAGNGANDGAYSGADNRPDASVGALDAPGTATVPPVYGGAKNGAGARATGATSGASDEATGAGGASGSIALAWPVRGPVINGFDDSKNKGINIGGASGEPVRAAGAGRVVYAGNGLRGYGNLVIIKHNATFLTAYAHNRALTVKEGESVAKGQKIAEMGNSDADRVMLHFEVRRQGKPVDPLKYLPPR